ncbi:MAG TPA: site-specific integrase [Pyrinomonadaceae bacterium]|nr:site-specific integrase [Pyrinomonadaceae bacterium]
MIVFRGKVSFVEKAGSLHARATYRDRNGDRRQVWRRVETTKAAAKLAVVTAIETILNAPEAAESNFTFSEFAKWYVENHVVPAAFHDGIKYKGKKSWRPIRTDIKALVAHFGRKKIADIRREDVLKYRTARLETPTVHGKRRAIASVNHELRTLTAMLNVAWHNEWLNRPLNTTGLIMSAAENRRERIPTAQEFDAILDTIPKEPQRWHLLALALLIADCGARPVELFNLKWNDLDMSEGSVRLTSDKGRKRTVRKIFLTRRAREAVADLPRFNEYVFGGIKSVKRSWATVLREAWLPKIDLYSLRHLYISRLDALGISLSLKMRLSGHTTATMSDHYTHFDDDQLKAVADKLDQ